MLEMAIVNWRLGLAQSIMADFVNINEQLIMETLGVGLLLSI